MSKIQKEKSSLTHNRKENLERFETEKAKVIALLTKATPDMVAKLNEYTAFSTLNRTAKELEIIDAKLRVINYLEDEIE